jgi:Glycosyl hydrolases family 16
MPRRARQPDYNHSRLTPCFDWNTESCTTLFNEGRERYLPSQVTVSNGTAKLTATPAAMPYPSSACQNDSCTYNSGLLSAARPRAGDGSDYLYKFTYGYVESRFKFPATQGFLTAFWMLPANTSYQYRNEIDILELLGDDPTTMFMTYSYDNRSQSFAVNKGKFNKGACPVRDYSKEFVSMGVDWEPNRIAWYIDGIKCAEYTDSSQIENSPMQLILNMMTSSRCRDDGGRRRHRRRRSADHLIAVPGAPACGSARLPGARRRGQPSHPGERLGRDGHGSGQEIAALTSSATFFSTVGLHFWSAYDTGHMSPSSRLAASWKPRVEYRYLNLPES